MQLEFNNSVSCRTLSLPDMIANKMYENNIIFSINENVMHH